MDERGLEVQPTTLLQWLFVPKSVHRGGILPGSPVIKTSPRPKFYFWWIETLTHVMNADLDQGVKAEGTILAMVSNQGGP